MTHIQAQQRTEGIQDGSGAEHQPSITIAPISGASPQTHARLPYFAGLDGLRAIAVIAVLLYHAGFGLRGGFLGVETFFVLSGFLITALLVGEWQQHGRINLRNFWLRRARRLLPALFLVLAGSFALTIILGVGGLAALRSDILASLAYVMNWHLILSERSYFDPLVRPPLLQHLWSLAIEEQFYLVWPLLFGLGLRFLRRRGFLVAILVATAASATLMALMYQPGIDASRVYYGTDTRASAILIGCALALIWSPWNNAQPSAGYTVALLDVAGLAALAVLLFVYVQLFASHPLLYRGGFAIISVATIIVVAALTHPQTRVLPYLLANRLFNWIGRRSYGIYLWHWPIFMVTRPGADVPLNGWSLLVLRLAIVAVVADLSFRYLEQPIQRGGLAAVWPGIRGTLGPKQLSTRLQQSGHLSFAWRPMWSLLVLCLVLVFALSVAPSRTIAPASASSAGALRSISKRTSAGKPEPTAKVSNETATVSATATPIKPTSGTATDTGSAPTARPTSAPQTQLSLAQFDPLLAAKLQQLLDATVADGSIPGITVSVSVPGQQPWNSASGIANIQEGRPMLPETNVRIASLSKMFTAVVVLQLAAEGVIDLDAPVASYLPDLLPNGDAITVRNLLSHTSGLYDYLEDWDFAIMAYQEPERTWTPQELVDYATQFAPSFQPGSEGNWDYASTNYVVLGMIVEKVTGNTLAQEMRQRIFEQLALKHTYFPPDEQLPDTLAHGYAGSDDQTAMAPSFAFATGNIVSTTDDIRRFVEALLGDALLPAESRAQMLTFVDGHGQYEMPALEYGLGIMRNRLAEGTGANGQLRSASSTTVVGHIGGIAGFRSAVWSSPDAGITISLGVNQASIDPNTIANQLYDTILTHQGR